MAKISEAIRSGSTRAILEKIYQGYIVKGEDLLLAASCGQFDIVKILTDRVDDLEITDDENKTPLALSCELGLADQAKYLIDRGADLNRQDRTGNSPVHYMVMNNMKDLFEYILPFLPDLLLINIEGKSPLELSVSRDILDIVGRQKVEQPSPPDSPGQSIIIESLEDAPSPLDFEYIRTIGKGSFGEVSLVKHKHTEEYFAMKVIKKKKIDCDELLRYIMTERNVLSYIKHPFIVSLKYAFQTQSRLFLIIDYCQGGDLGQYLDREQRFIESRAKLYAAEILLAIEELHRHHILYRDLKPDNIVLDSEGHVRLIDFGLSKEGLFETTDSFCGSYAYLPPEILNREEYGIDIDWYLFGVFVYEMLVGTPPYYAESTKQIMRNIQYMKLTIPENLQPVARDFLIKLLDKNQNNRMKDPESIKNHPFFDDIDWEKAYNKELEVPRPLISDISPRGETVPLATRYSLTTDSQKILGWSFISD